MKPMKRAGLVAGLLVLVVCVGWGQDTTRFATEDPTILQLLAEAGVNLEYPMYHTYSGPWEELLRIKAPLDYFERLVGLGVAIEPEVITATNSSPLVQAVEAGNAEVVDFLIKEGADVNRLHRDGMTPVHYAVLEEEPEILEKLILAGGNVRRSDKHGNTPLHTLFTIGGSFDGIDKKVERIRLLLAHGANVNAVNLDGDTPLLVAVSSFICHPKWVQVLLAGGPNVNMVNSKGETALILAAGNVQCPDIITLLLNAGADSKIKDNTGRTALDRFDMNQRINESPVRKVLKDAM
jgi:ankyrin repeat protein